MKVLVSSIACSPRGGSEGAVGWNAVRILAEQHDVFVLTRAALEEEWQAEKAAGRLPDNIQVRFLGKKRDWHRHRLIARGQSWLRYLEFNRLALAAAKRWHAEDPMDLVHQVTFAAWRVPTNLWKLGIPTIWGPVGGAGIIAAPFRKQLGLQGRLVQAVRDFQSALTKRSSAFEDCMKHCAVVIAANQETYDLLLPYRHGRPLTMIPVLGISVEKFRKFEMRGSKSRTGPLRLFAGGNLGQSELSRKESAAWRGWDKPLAGVRKKFWSGLHRGRKLLSGCYGRRGVEIQVFTDAKMPRVAKSSILEDKWALSKQIR